MCLRNLLVNNLNAQKHFSFRTKCFATTQSEDGGQSLKLHVAKACTEGKQWQGWNIDSFSGSLPDIFRSWTWCVFSHICAIEFFSFVAFFNDIGPKYCKFFPSKHPRWLRKSHDLTIGGMVT